MYFFQQLTSMPCKHVIKYLKHKRFPITQYTSEFWNTQHYRETYNHFIKPIPDMRNRPDALEENSLLAPKIKKKTW